MMGLNLHNVVRGAITAIHPDEDCTLYQSLGQKNIKGEVYPIYAEPQSIKANFQPDTDRLDHPDSKNVTSDTMTVYLYSNLSYPVMGVNRVPARTGDFIQRSDETYWLVTSIEDWSWDGWCKVDVHRQVVPPDFSASEWSDDYVGSDSSK